MFPKPILWLLVFSVPSTILTACDRRKPDHSNPASKLENEKESAQTLKPEPQRLWGDVRQRIPVITELGNGSFDSEGMKDVFRQITGEIMSAEVQPVSGMYSVFDIREWDGSYAMNYHAIYQTSPAKSRKLIDHLKDKWEVTIQVPKEKFLKISTCAMEIIVH